MAADRQTHTVIFTIGHSNHTLERFISLLKENHIEYVVDIRSRPYSRFASLFNRPVIIDPLRAEGIGYLFLGDKLGGMPHDPQFYDTDGHVSYHRIAVSPGFHEGIERLIKGSNRYRLALMCSEENPLNCHRFHLVSASLEKMGASVVHMRGDGRHQPHQELSNGCLSESAGEAQLNLFMSIDEKGG